MSHNLRDETREEIFRTLQTSFSDFPQFQTLVAGKLRQAIADTQHVEINTKTVKKVTERYFTTDVFKTPEQKVVLEQIRIIFKTCYVLVLSKYESAKRHMWPSVDVLLQNYPQFEGQTEEELRLLLNFRNMMRVALDVIPARLNKQCLLKVAARLEGSQNEYVTGGGQKPCVTRRVDIYEREGGVMAEKRTDRLLNAQAAAAAASDSSDEETSKKKRKKESLPTAKAVRMRRLPTDDLRQLLHHSDPANPIPSIYQTQDNSNLEVQALLGLRNTSGNASNPLAPSNLFSYTPMVDSAPLTSSGLHRENTDMLIAGLDLLSGTSATWHLEDHDLSQNLKSQNALLALTSTSKLAKQANVAVKNENSEVNPAEAIMNEIQLGLPKPIIRGRTTSDIFVGGSLTDDMF